MNLKENMKRFGTKNLINEGIVYELSPAVFEKMILQAEKVGHQLYHDGKSVYVKIADGNRFELKLSGGPGLNDDMFDKDTGKPNDGEAVEFTGPDGMKTIEKLR